MMKYAVTIQSANRPENVKRMTEFMFGIDLHWFVPMEHVAAYHGAGAHNVYGVEGTMPMKPHQLNAANRWAEKEGYEYLVTCDDDILASKRLEISPEGKKKLVPCEFLEVIGALITELDKTEYAVGSVPNTSNGFYMSGRVKEYGMMMGGLCVHKTYNFMGYDSKLTSNEDLDYYILQHVEFGGLIKHEGYCVTFDMQGKTDRPGGYTGFRTSALEAINAENITKKWGDPRIIVTYNGPGESNYKGVKFRRIHLDSHAPKGITLESLFTD
jgi:hypothetical protein